MGSGGKVGEGMKCGCGCGSIVRPKGKGPLPVYASLACKQRAYRQRCNARKRDISRFKPSRANKGVR